MKVLVFTNSSLFVKIASGLLSHAQLAGIIIPDMLNHDLLSTIEYAADQQIPLLKVSAADLQENTAVASWIAATNCSTAMVLTFPFKIPAPILNIPEKGFYNVHYSKLPSYKGADPLFWQLKNGEQQVALTVHRMTEKFDDGPIIFSQGLALLPGENYGLAKTRLTMLLQHNLENILQNISSGKYIEVSPLLKTSYYKRPQADELTINWEKQSAQEIENLVNATNPMYNGATTYLNGLLIRVLEVSGVDGGFDPGTIMPGTIFHIDPHHGPMVLTADKQLILLNVIETESGVFSGKKFCAMGLKLGDRFLNLN